MLFGSTLVLAESAVRMNLDCWVAEEILLEAGRLRDSFLYSFTLNTESLTQTHTITYMWVLLFVFY